MSKAAMSFMKRAKSEKTRKLWAGGMIPKKDETPDLDALKEDDNSAEPNGNLFADTQYGDFFGEEGKEDDQPKTLPARLAARMRRGR